MKIASANLQMASTHAASQHHEIKESLRMWIGNQRPDFEGRGPAQPPAAQVEISDAAKAAQKADRDRDPLEGDPRLMLLRSIIEALTGRKIKLLDAQDLDPGQESVSVQDPNQPAARPAGYGVEYDYHESYSETETTTFAASGTVRTADGKDIQFKLDLTMARSYAEESNVSLRLGDAVRRKDPLVINFDGTAPQLTDARFSFDLDADGRAEKINFVRPGSGFLVFDRNRDGKATDGSELFGPATGNGFAELAKLDEDRNGWIDENDAAYKDLAIWIKDTEGKDQLKSLQESKVGAIALAQVETPFDIKDNANRMQGQVRDSGVFLQEDGKAGTIQQIDLTV